MLQLAYILALYLTGDHFLLQILLAVLIIWIMDRPTKIRPFSRNGVELRYETPEETEERHRREAEKKAREEEKAHAMAEEERSDAEDKKDETEMQDADLTDAEQREIELEETELSDAEWQEY